MMHRIVRATGRQDFTVEVVFEDGARACIDLADFVATGEVTRPLRDDPGYFVRELRIVDGGDAMGWPDDVHIDADALWYRSHPQDWERDFGPEAGKRDQRTA